MPLGELGRNYSVGDVIFREGDIGNVMYVIQEGRVRISRSTERGEVSITTFGPGDIFGEVALFEEGLQAVTVTVIENARILSIDKKKFFQSMSRDPSLAFNLLKTMSDRIRSLDSEFIRLKNRTMEIMEWGMDLEETCHVILEEARDAVEADNGSVMILNLEKQVFEIAAAFGTHKPTKTTIALGEGIAGYVLSTGHAELVNNVMSNPRFQPGALPISSMICVPLGTREQNLGVINLSNSSDERLFSQVDLKFIKSLATYASVAMGNAIRLDELTSATHSMLDKFHSRDPGDDDGEIV
jgi:transcriptional regulator with GAF, ATPase, and Fis domain